MLRRSTVEILSFCALLLSVSSCGVDSSETLFIDLITDYVPGQEFTRVRTEIVGDDGSVLREDFATSEGQDFARGVRVASINVPSGAHSVILELRDASGNVFAERLGRVVVDGTSVRTLVLTRDCRDVSCPLAVGDANTSCLGGMCVAPECTVETPALCPADACVVDGDCPSPSSECGVSRCNEGVCLSLARDELCDASEWCSPEDGCVANTPMDGGVVVDTAGACGVVCGGGELRCVVAGFDPGLGQDSCTRECQSQWPNEGDSTCVDGARFVLTCIEANPGCENLDNETCGVAVEQLSACANPE